MSVYEREKKKLFASGGRAAADATVPSSNGLRTIKKCGFAYGFIPLGSGSVPRFGEKRSLFASKVQKQVFVSVNAIPKSFKELRYAFSLLATSCDC